MERRIPGIMIAAIKSGSGKTMVTCALLEALKNRGMSPCGFKCGPDYIDPLFHGKVIGVPSYNLDSYLAGEGQLKEILAFHAKEKEIAIVEGVMGLYDGIGGISERGSAYHVASILKLPIVLVIDVKGMGRSILPILSGFLQYDKGKRIAGIILNRATSPFYQSIAPLIEEELQIPVLGFLPFKAECEIDSRHLGLKLPDEIAGLKEQIHVMADTLEENVDVDRILEIAERNAFIYQVAEMEAPIMPRQVKVGVAMDEAFCFYYKENLNLLEQYGAELVYFSPLHDRKLPKGLDAVLLGGGYPELYADRLEENETMRRSVRQALKEGMPSLAECGGFLYLHEELKDDKGNYYKMCGVLPEKCFYTGKLVRFGYIEIKEKTSYFMKKEETIKGHEFHYYDSTGNGRDCRAQKPLSDRKWDCIYDTGECFWGFPHLYYPSNPGFVMHFIEKAKSYQDRKESGR